MSLVSHFSHLKFFQNKELNEFYVAISLDSLALSMISVFVPVYLYGIGYAIQNIIFFFFLFSFFFVIFSYIGARIVSKIGVKHSMLLSSPLQIIYFLGLNLLDTWPILFFILPIIISWRMILYNYGYHLNFIIHSDKNLRGRQLSIVGALNMTMTVIAPLISGVIIFYWGFTSIFYIGSFLLALSMFPLLLTKDKYEEIKFNEKKLLSSIFKKENRGLLKSFSGYAIESIIGRVIWPVFLIIIFINVKSMGFVLTLSMVISVSVYYLAGRATDKYNKTILLKLGTVIYFFGWMGRIFANTSLKILFVDSYKNISEKVLHIPWQAYSYDLAKQGDYFKFIVAREIIFNLSRIIIMPLLILLFYLNVYPFIISFLTASVFSLLYIFIINNKVIQYAD